MEPTDTPSRRSSGLSSPDPGLRFASIAALLACTLVAHMGVAHGQDPAVARITITGAPPRFAVPDCVAKGADQAAREVCRVVTQVLRDDLAFEAVFPFVPDSLIKALPALVPAAPNFEDWSSVGAQVLVTTEVSVQGKDAAVVLRVYHVGSQQTMLARRYTNRVDTPRAFAHQASDDIMTLTQYRGVARTQIAFSSDRDAKAPGTKEIYVVDYDGYNPRRMTVNGKLNITPAWAPDGRSIAYVSYRNGSPQIFRAFTTEARSAEITDAKSQAFSPVFSPDGTKLAFASDRGGKLDVWVAKADGSGARRVTSGSASAPAWSPTGREIAFMSDRTGIGNPQIYITDAEGLETRRLTRVGNYNDAPAWSPSKEFAEIAYSSRLEGGFEIAVVDIASGAVRQITQGLGSCEYPTWAPSGRHLAFSCTRGDNLQIVVADRLGAKARTLQTGPGNHFHPDWGP